MAPSPNRFTLILSPSPSALRFTDSHAHTPREFRADSLADPHTPIFLLDLFPLDMVYCHFKKYVSFYQFLVCSMILHLLSCHHCSDHCHLLRNLVSSSHLYFCLTYPDTHTTARMMLSHHELYQALLCLKFHQTLLSICLMEKIFVLDFKARVIALLVLSSGLMNWNICEGNFEQKHT